MITKAARRSAEQTAISAPLPAYVYDLYALRAAGAPEPVFNPACGVPWPELGLAALIL
jgi:hypothetical protein